MEIFKPRNILRANPRLRFIVGDHFVRFLFQILRFNQLNNKYIQNDKRNGIDLVDDLIKILRINYFVDVNELEKRIPKTGSVIVICNHPFGGLEYLLLIKILSQIRSDFKIASTQSMQKIEPIGEYFLEEQLIQKKI